MHYVIDLLKYSNYFDQCQDLLKSCQRQLDLSVTKIS